MTLQLANGETEPKGFDIDQTIESKERTWRARGRVLLAETISGVMWCVYWLRLSAAGPFSV